MEMKRLALAVSVLLAPFPLSGQTPPESPAEVDSGYLHVGADSLFYEATGNGPVLVLIHDGVVHREVWENQFASFGEAYRVVRYDRRGFGASPAASEAYTDLDDLTALFGHLEIRKASLAGMSSGGRLAMDFTLAHPDRVGALVLVGAVVRGFSYTQHFRTRGGKLPPDLSDADAVAWYASRDPYEVNRANQAASRRLEVLAARGFRPEERKFHGSFSGPISLQHLGEIQVPTLILVGEVDIPDVHAHAGAINAGIPGSRREVVSGAGHLVPLEQPEVFNRMVMEFLGGR